MDVENLTIRAELVDETGPGAASARANVAGVAAATTQANVAAGAAASGGLARLNNQFAALEKVGKSLGSSISDLVGWVGSKLEAAAQRGARALELLGIGAAVWGAKVTMSLQQSQMAMETFMGSVQDGDRMFAQLKLLRNPFTIGALTQGAESLLTAGADPARALGLTKAIANIASQNVDPNSAFQAISQAVNRIQETGRIEPRALLAFMSNGVDAYGMIGQEMGIPRDDVKKRLQEMMKSGTGDIAAGNFLSDLVNLSGPNAKFQGGLARYRQTDAGRIGEAKKDIGDTLSVIEAPLLSWIANRAMPKLSSYVTGVRDRAPGLLPGIGADLKGGDMSGAARMIDELLGGGGKLVPILDPLMKGLQSLFRIFKDEVIPAGKDLLKIAVPALHMLDDVLSFMAGHKGLMEGLIVSLVGIAGVRAAVGPVTQLAGAFGGLRSAIGAGDFLGAASAFLKGLFGIGGGAGAASRAGGLPGGVVATGEAGSAELGYIGPGLMAITGGALAYQGINPNKKASNATDLETIGGGALLGAAIGSVVPVIGTLLGGLAGGAAGGVVDIFHHLFGKSGKKPAGNQTASGGIHYYAGNIIVQANNAQQFQTSMEQLGKANQERGYQSPYNPNTT